MPIPTFDRMLRPSLALSAERPLTRREATEAMAKHFGLTDEEASARIPSGAATYVRHRVGWAMTHLTKASLIEKVATHTYAASQQGKQFLTKHPEEFGWKVLREVPGYVEAWKSSGAKDGDGGDEITPGTTPLEALDSAVKTLHTELKGRLLKAILDQSPTFFEELVLDVLVAMGYGGSRADAAEHLGRSGDEGVDGAVNQDPLGLDKIVVQAKRYAPERPIDRTTIQAFFGSMTGQGITKGIFITTSSFAPSAREFVTRGTTTKVVLIDGEQLLDLMLRHKIGVRVHRQVEVMELDQNYFSEEE